MDDVIAKKSKRYYSMQLFNKFALKFFYFFILKLSKKNDDTVVVGPQV